MPQHRKRSGESTLAQTNAPTLSAMASDELAAFERAVITQAPAGAVVVGASISPDGLYGAALTFSPNANYLMDDVLRRFGNGTAYLRYRMRT